MTLTVTKWWLLRHAPVMNQGGRMYGQEDVDSDCSDSNLFAGLAETLPKNSILVTSHLKRTIQTAEKLIERGFCFSEHLIEQDLCEQNYGDWEGLTYSEFGAKQNESELCFQLPHSHVRAPNGESFADLTARTAQAIARINNQHGGKGIVSIVHGGTIRAAIALASGCPLEYVQRYDVDNLSLTRLDHIKGENGFGWQIRHVNLSPHWIASK